MNSKYKGMKLYRKIFLVGILVFMVNVTVIITLWGLRKNRNTHVYEEMKSISNVQVNLLNLEIESQYVPLRVLADYIESGKGVFAEGDMVKMASILKSVHRLCTIGLADEDGNVIDYEGNDLGNISDRDYFQKVIDGTNENYVTYLATTKVVSQPRVLFSVPVYKNQEIIGVIFASKEINILENSLFIEDFFDETASSFIADWEGNIIAANSKTYEDISENKLFDGIGKEKDTTLQEEIKKILEETKHGEFTSILEDGKYLSHVSIGINDWELFSVVDDHSIMLQYRDSENVLLKLIVLLVVLLFFMVVIVGVYFYIHHKAAIMEARSFRNQYECYKSLLYEMDCTVIEYDVIRDCIQYNTIFENLLDEKADCTFQQLITALEEKHPEYNISELRIQKKKATELCESVSFESIVIRNKEGRKTLQWLKVVLLPIQDMRGEITNIFAAILNTTDFHEEFEESSRFMEVVPGGMHRCYLDQPIHLEFASEGLCKMLGYTMEEFRDLVGTKYSLAIAEEDRGIFRQFVLELAEKEGIKNCEYRMICKDGSLLTVSDTMESKRNAAGVMYGYSIIIDLSEYKKKQNEMELELAETKAELMQARIVNANSQMQPHFLYNALASIREIVLVDPEYASDLIFDFSTHLRACIRSMSNENLIPFSQELNNIKAYVNIEQMRFGDKLKVEYDIEETDFDIIPLGLQPVVENSIRHGIYERGRAGGTVKIKSYENNNNWNVEILDDGVGFDVEDMRNQIESGKRDSTGLRNMVLRFEKQMKAKVDIWSEVGVGTSVIIQIPKGERDESNNR